MFSKEVGEEKGLVLVQESETRLDAAIHMFFVPFDLGVIWIDKQGKIVDHCLAKAWQPFYMPARPAKYILEIHPQRLAEFQTGDQVIFDAA